VETVVRRVIRFGIFLAFLLALTIAATGKSELFPDHLRAYMDQTGLDRAAAIIELHSRRIVALSLLCAASTLSVFSFFVRQRGQKGLIVVLEYTTLFVAILLALISALILRNGGYGPGGLPM
jgi:hypothetical protein